MDEQLEVEITGAMVSIAEKTLAVVEDINVGKWCRVHRDHENVFT